MVAMGCHPMKAAAAAWVRGRGEASNACFSTWRTPARTWGQANGNSVRGLEEAGDCAGTGHSGA
ncbi:predicted protein [Coccidioides posadasii str. Silveira]|uniref:Predicted protein n=1 Tax=Coccidioides posadasii (strain RMSCC 757 / Silveira) TaxID=443226 RepID=E9D6T5_COCPS|nr:predicted protein [Coccidioides posadasii str. Silveira]